MGEDRISAQHIYTRIPAALQHSAKALELELEYEWVGTSLLASALNSLNNCDGIFAAPTPFYDLKGFYNSVSYARVNKIPWIGACGGSQQALIEYAHNVLDFPKAVHVEDKPQADFKFVNYLPEIYRVSNDGPLKTFEVSIKDGSQALSAYGANNIQEQFLANYMIGHAYIKLTEDSGLKMTGFYEKSDTPCLFELDHHPFFVGCLFQPQMNSSEDSPHPLITEFLRNCSSKR